MCTLVFWGVLFLLIQQGERFFLLPETVALETPTASLLIKVFLTGLAADLVTATGGIVLAAILATLLSIPFALIAQRNRIAEWLAMCRRGMLVSLAVIAILLLAVLIADICYYTYSHHHLDFVFFEFMDELLFSPNEGTIQSQAGQQTSAELDDASKWLIRIGAFLSLEVLIIMAWWVGFKNRVEPLLTRWEFQQPVATNLLLVVAVVSGMVGFGPLDIPVVRAIQMESEAYYSLAQNPVLYARDPLRDAFLSKWSWSPAHHDMMNIEEAVQITQEVLGRGTQFPFVQYPLVQEKHEPGVVQFNHPVNVLLIFVEGLDRRYLNQTIRGIRTTSFLDRFKEESFYFENFFTNGVQTSRGLFASFCSHYPRQGTAVIKTRYAQDYLCLPSLLRKAGYRTEMVVGQHRNINNLQTFMERNGLDRLYDEADFPSDAERVGLGVTDASIFDLMRTRIEALQSLKQPFFLAALTLSTHHPFIFPKVHPEVRALHEVPDQYLAALRYFDLEFERFFTGLQRDGLLDNTIVLVLGDHGRHEAVGQTDIERLAGHFTAPLFVWMDPSLRTPETSQPRTVASVASQVDLAPTILALNRLTPHVSPFVGRDLTCLFVRDCLTDNFAYLSSVYDDLIGLADQDGLWLYSFRRGVFYQIDLKLKGQARPLTVTATDNAPHYRRLLALYLTTNVLLERNQIWSWKDLGGEL
jgi:membrane-anchored protein YejM (alkaline phosphatase superfamily)